MRVRQIKIIEAPQLELSLMSHVEKTEKIQGKITSEEIPKVEEVREDCGTESTEEVHGGEEASGDIEESPNSLEGGEEEANVIEKSETNSPSSSKNDESNENDQSESESKIKDQRQEQEQEQEQNNSSSQNDQNNNNDLQSNEETENDFKIQDQQKQADEVNEENSENNSNDQSDNDNQQNNSEATLDEFGINQDNDFDLEQEKGKDEDESGGDGEEGETNAERAYDLYLEDFVPYNKLRTSFARLIKQIAELERETHRYGTDRWDMNRLMLRKFTQNSLNACKQSVEQEGIIILLDTSGSCIDYADYFSSISTLAEKLGELEVYEAPNASLYIEDQCWGENWPWKNRRILFFGDFDGGAILCYQAKRNQLVWCSCEERYHELFEHSWCGNLSLDDFQGCYIHASSPKEFVKKLKKPIKWR